jgi:hypothetical protein
LIGVGLILLIVVIKRRKKQKNEKKRKNEQQLNENNSMIHTVEATNNSSLTELSTIANSLQKSKISFNELAIEKKIGTGSYGKVCLGKWNTAPVALKFCKNTNRINTFINEIRLMMYV